MEGPIIYCSENDNISIGDNVWKWYCGRIQQVFEKYSPEFNMDVQHKSFLLHVTFKKDSALGDVLLSINSNVMSIEHCEKTVLPSLLVVANQ